MTVEYYQSVRAHVGTAPLLLPGASLLLLDPRHRLVLVQRRDSGVWGLPGGYMNLGESAEETALRELREEIPRLGSESLKLHLFGVYTGQGQYYKYQNGDEVHNVAIIYSATLDAPFTDEPGDGHEILSAHAFPLELVPSKLLEPERPIIEDLVRKYSVGCLKGQLGSAD
jgi:8-oxo-dGTP pyrophosphatase MutT (NUDIX family)